MVDVVRFVAISAVLALALAGCGSESANEDAGGSEAADRRLSLRDYRAQAGTICNEEMARYDEMANVPGVEPAPKDIAALADQLAGVTKSLEERLSELRPPERIESDVDRMLRSFARLAALLQEVSESETTAEAIQRTSEESADLWWRAHQIARRIGIPNGCEGRVRNDEDSGARPALPPEPSGDP